MKNETLHTVIDNMHQARVLVIGDVMLDMYEHCMVKRISPEAPVPIATVVDDSYFLGGAGNVANNARALGAKVSLVGVIGTDREGDVLREIVAQNGIDHDGLVVEDGRVTTLKKRVVSGTQQLIRIDREMTHNIKDSTQTALRSVLATKIKECDVIVISDYCKGIFTESLINYIKEEAKKDDKKILVDSKSRNLPMYSGVYLIKPNKGEAEVFVDETFAHDYANLEKVGRRISSILDLNLVITLGKDGMALFAQDTFSHMKTEVLQVFDVSGAGDTVLSVLAVAVATGAKLEEAVHLSNIAAGHVVSDEKTAWHPRVKRRP